MSDMNLPTVTPRCRRCDTIGGVMVTLTNGEVTEHWHVDCALSYLLEGSEGDLSSVLAKEEEG